MSKNQWYIEKLAQKAFWQGYCIRLANINRAKSKLDMFKYWQNQAVEIGLSYEKLKTRYLKELTRADVIKSYPQWLTRNKFIDKKIQFPNYVKGANYCTLNHEKNTKVILN